MARIGEVKRVTKETNVSVKINLDGTGVAENNTGIPFLDHMLDVSLFSFCDYHFLILSSVSQFGFLAVFIIRVVNFQVQIFENLSDNIIPSICFS